MGIFQNLFDFPLNGFVLNGIALGQLFEHFDQVRFNLEGIGQ